MNTATGWQGCIETGSEGTQLVADFNGGDDRHSADQACLHLPMDRWTACQQTVVVAVVVSPILSILRASSLGTNPFIRVKKRAKCIV